jgi:hypothetical protein
MHILIRHQYGKMEDMAMTDYEQEGKKSWILKKTSTVIYLKTNLLIKEKKATK